MLSLKKLLYKLTQRQIQRITVDSATVTITADSRSYVDIDTGMPNNAVIISREVANTPNTDWVRVLPMLGGANLTTIRCRYHNEYSGPLTGKFSLRVAYYLA